MIVFEHNRRKKMGADKAIARLRYILTEFKGQNNIPYYRIQDVIRDFDREESKMLDALYKENSNIS